MKAICCCSQQTPHRLDSAFPPFVSFRGGDGQSVSQPHTTDSMPQANNGQSQQHGRYRGKQPGIPDQLAEVPPAEGKAQRRKQADKPEGELRVSAECVFQYPLKQRFYGEEDESEQEFKEEIHVWEVKNEWLVVSPGMNGRPVVVYCGII